MDTCKVSVIIPNYNGREYLRECLECLLLQSYRNFEVIVVDNGSVDGSEKIVEDFEGYKLVRNEKNLGFAKAVNQGIRLSRSEYVILLNNDAMAEYNFIEEMVKGISKSKKIFSCASRMIQYNDRSKLDNTGDFYTIMGYAFQRGMDADIKRYKRAGKIFSACAGAAIYRREVFEEIGFFDERHFAYLEDMDVGFRANIYGYRSIYLPKAVVYHVGSGTSGSRYNEFKTGLAARNSVWLYYKNLPVVMLVLNAPFIFAGHVMKYMYFRKHGLEKVYLNGVVDGFKGLGKCKKVEYKRENLENYIRIQIGMIKSLSMWIERFIQ